MGFSERSVILVLRVLIALRFDKKHFSKKYWAVILEILGNILIVFPVKYMNLLQF